MPRQRVTSRRPRETLQTVADSYCRHLRAEGKATNTIDVYGDSAKSLIAFLSNPVAIEVTTEDVERWLIHLRDEKHNAPNTLAIRRRGAMGLFDWMVAEGDIRRSPLEGIAPPRIPDAPPPVLTEDQQRALLESARGTAFAARRDTAILRLFMSTGIRRGEMAGIRLADLDMDREIVTVTGKTGTRAVTFGHRASQALDRYLRLRSVHAHAYAAGLWLGTRGPLKEYGVEEIVKRHSLEANLPLVTPHTFRHTWAAGCLALGHHEQDVSANAGWRSPQMVGRYGRAVRAERAQNTNRTNNPGDRI